MGPGNLTKALAVSLALGLVGTLLCLTAAGTSSSEVLWYRTQRPNPHSHGELQAGEPHRMQRGSPPGTRVPENEVPYTGE